MRNRIALIGMPAAGKSRVGGILAQQLGVPFLDTDALVEESAGRTIPEIFADCGEQAFRNLETDAIRLATRAERAVLSCGGGAILREENVRLLKAFGTVVWLNASAKTLFARAENGRGRPLLAENAEQKIQALLVVREPLYRAAADCIVTTDGKDAQTVARAVLKKLQTP